MDQNQTTGTNCPDWGCCCDHGRECCNPDGGGNFDHFGERGGCKQLAGLYVCPRGYVAAGHKNGEQCPSYPDHCDGCIWKWLATGL